MLKDTLYRDKRARVCPFTFDDSVAGVFDDMIRRSVPGYGEVVVREAQLAAQHFRPGSRIYDLGCSSGNLEAAMALEPALSGAPVIAVDNAPAMLAKLVAKTAAAPGPRIHPLCMDVCEVAIADASVVVINYTLQFIAPSAREALLTRVYEGLSPGGILLLAEKIVHPLETMSLLQQAFYYRFKRENDYSDMEISQKREALENVLVPDTLETHLARLNRIGFEHVDVWFKWFNFAAVAALKTP